MRQRPLREERVSEPAPASGRLVVRFGPFGTEEQIEIERIIVSTDSGTATEAIVYEEKEDPSRLRDFTPNGNRDVGEYRPPIRLPGTATLLIVWTGASLNALAKASVQGLIVYPDR